MSRVVQRWECWCGETYDAPIAVFAVECSGKRRPHGQRTRNMKLVEGSKIIPRVKPATASKAPVRRPTPPKRAGVKVIQRRRSGR